jgi:hypothetical protein
VTEEGALPPGYVTVHEAAHRVLVEMLGKTAQHKNVILEEVFHAAHADQLLARMSFTEAYQVGWVNDSGLGIALRAVNAHLDTFMMARLFLFIAEIEGRKVDSPEVAEIVARIVTRIEGAAERCIVWPDLLAILHEHYGDRPFGPVVDRYADGTVITTYYQSGKLHRDPREGPAWHRKGAEGEACEYVVRGKLHRDHRDGPATTNCMLDGKPAHGEEYWKHGERHRPSTEGPAVLQVDPSGKVLFEIYIEEGKPHRDPAQGPAWFGIRDGLIRLEFSVHGLTHRAEQDGPAVIETSEATGVVVLEQYYRDGQLHRDHGPAWIDRDPETGTVVSEVWVKNGDYHRDDGPALIGRNADGEVTTEDYWQHGEFIESRSRETAEGEGADA